VKAAIQNFTTTLWRENTVISAPNMKRMGKLHQRYAKYIAKIKNPGDALLLSYHEILDVLWV
jgi:hypothetical protein